MRHKPLQSARWLTITCRLRDGCKRLATTISRQSWHCCPSTEHTPSPRLPCFECISNSGASPWRNQTGKKPSAATDDWSQTVRDWEWHVNEVMPAGNLASTHRFCCQREAGTELDFFRLVDRTVALPNVETTLPDTGASGPQASVSSASSRE